MAEQAVHRNECRQDDPRLESLKVFFRGLHSPLEKLAAVFLNEADAHELDWRLLPGLSFVESTGGLAARGNNIFGWNNGNHTFRTVSEAIHVVATSLSSSPIYKGKGLLDKIRTYNRNPDYLSCVRRAMQQIAGDEGDDE